MAAKVTFAQIEAFRAVMRSGSVVGAARLLNVTQPGVSRLVGAMETRLDYALFERRGRRLVPTPEADALYREVEHAFEGLERINQIAQDIRFQRAGALRVASLPGLAQGFVPQAIARFLSTRPNVNVFMESLPSRQIADLVATHQFDVGFIELPLSRSAIEIVPLPPVRNVAVMASDHLLAKKEMISMRDLDGQRMILLSQQSFVRYQIDDMFQKARAAPNVVLETPSSTIACALVAAGAGITLVSEWTAAPFASKGVVVRPLVEETEGRFAMIFPQLAARMLLADAFADEVRCLAERKSDRQARPGTSIV